MWTSRERARAPARFLWKQWRELGGISSRTDGLCLPTQAFTSSGTYAPTFCVGTIRPLGRFIYSCATDMPLRRSRSGGKPRSDPTFKPRWLFSRRNQDKLGSELKRCASILMRRTSTAGRGARLQADETLAAYHRICCTRGMPITACNPTVTIDDFFPPKAGMCCGRLYAADPYSGCNGIEEVEPGSYRVVVSASTRHGILRVTLKLLCLNHGRLVSHRCSIAFIMARTSVAGCENFRLAASATSSDTVFRGTDSLGMIISAWSSTPH